MSPARRIHLAWCGRWEVPAVALIQTGLTIALAALAMSIPGSTPEGRANELARPFAGFLLLPLVLGWRLRTLIGVEALALSPVQTAWHLRVFAGIILPPTLLLLAVPGLVVGKPALWTVAQAVCMTFLGIWLGYAMLRSVLPWVLYVCYFLAMDRLVDRPGQAGLASSVSLTLAVAGAWYGAGRILRRPWLPDWRWNGAGIWERWSDACFPIAGRVAPGRLPGLLLPFQIELGSRDLRLLALVGLPLVAVTFPLVVLWRAVEPGVMWMLAATLVGAVPWMRQFRSASAVDDGGGLKDRGRLLLAIERLRPWSRRKGAAACLATALAGTLGTSCTLGIGVILGYVIACHWRGWDPGPGLWILPAYAVASATWIAAAAILSQVGPWLPGLVVAMATPLLLLMGPAVVLAGGPTGPAGLLAISVLLALVLPPLAWHRLAEAELP